MKKRSFSFDEYSRLMGKAKARPLSKFPGSETSKLIQQKMDLRRKKARMHKAFVSVQFGKKNTFDGKATYTKGEFV